MKKYHLFKVVALLVLCCVMFGCEKEDTPTSKLGSIYGTVTDFATGDPVSNANVRINPKGETTLTGMDGTFEFVDLPSGSYSLSLSKNGYVDLDDDYIIEIKNGNNVHRDVQLRSQYQSFRITVDGIETNILDFGIDPSVTLISYNVENNGTTEIDLDFRKSGDWITIENSYVDNIEPNSGITTYAKIIRSALTMGNNIGYIYVSSGTLTKTIVIKAQGLGNPVVSNPVLSNFQSLTTDVRSSVTSDGGWSIVDKGFQYIYHNQSYDISCGPGTNNFQAQIPVGLDSHYYDSKVRAYASNGIYTTYSGWAYINK